MEFWYFASSFLINWLLLKLCLPYTPKFLLDIPNVRSSHINPKPKVGGLFFVITAVIFAIFQKYQLILYCLPIAIVGFFDDIYSLPKTFRYGAQLFTASLILFNSSNLRNFLTKNDLLNSSILILFLLILITAVINFTNFMDGLDGILAANLSISFFIAAFIFNGSLYPIVGSLLAFLVWNWSPSKVFMGDMGSTFLGAVYIASVIEAPSIQKSLSLLFISTPIFADALLCVIRRYFAGHKIFDSHKLHLYQRLYQGGLSHSKVTILYLFSTIFLSIVYILLGFVPLLISSTLVILFGVWLDKNVAKVFN